MSKIPEFGSDAPRYGIADGPPPEPEFDTGLPRKLTIERRIVFKIYKNDAKFWKSDK